MALTPLQRRICLLLADVRRQGGERDVDLFHDTAEALAFTWRHDRDTLVAAGFRVTPSHEGPTFVQARVEDATRSEILQWVQDSAYRFFPLVEDETFGLTLHPFDHATNKVLALAGRREARDWIDAIQCHENLQPLGYLAWASSGKDPGLSPLFILEQAARTRYVQVEIDRLDFEGPTPLAGDLSVRWHRALEEAREIVRLLPPEQVGRCVLDTHGALQRAAPSALAEELARGRAAFHSGCIRGAFPEIRQ